MSSPGGFPSEPPVINPFLVNNPTTIPLPTPGAVERSMSVLLTTSDITVVGTSIRATAVSWLYGILYDRIQLASSATADEVQSIELSNQIKDLQSTILNLQDRLKQSNTRLDVG